MPSRVAGLNEEDELKVRIPAERGRRRDQGGGERLSCARHMTQVNKRKKRRVGFDSFGPYYFKPAK